MSFQEKFKELTKTWKRIKKIVSLNTSNYFISAFIN